MATFDNKHWYFISRQFPRGEAIAFNTSLRAFGGTDYNESSVFLSPDSGHNSTNFQWQLFPVQSPPNGSYVLRPQNVPGGFLNAIQDLNPAAPKCTTPAGASCTASTVGILPSVDLNAVWTFTETLDGTGSFYMSNSRNGSFRIDLWNNGAWVNMSPNITDNRQTQKFAVIAVGLVTDPALNKISNSLLHYQGANETFPYASIAASSPSAASSTTSSTATATSTSVPIPIPPGPPIGAIVGAVLGVAAIAIIVFLWWFLRKRKAKSQAAYQPASSGQHSPMAMDELPPSYNDDPTKASMNVEVSGQPLAEAPSDGAHEMSVEAQRLRVEASGSEAPRYELPG